MTFNKFWKENHKRLYAFNRERVAREVWNAALESKKDLVCLTREEVNEMQSMLFNVGELLSAVSEAHKADALFELKHDYKALSKLRSK